MVIEYKKEGKIAIFTINNPKVNSLTVQAIRELHDTMVDFRDDDELWVGIITGAGNKAFCGGADIVDLLPFLRDILPQNPSEMPTTHMGGLDIWKPLIAAVNGVALGGGLEVALACDIRIASERALFGLPEVTLGLIPGWGGTQRLPRMITAGKAAEMLLMGKRIGAQEAYRIGLVNAVVPPDEVMPTAMKWAETICQAAPLAVRAAKEAMIKGSSLSLEDGLKLESALEGYCVHTEDFEEGRKAFTEKRKPNYQAK